MPESDLPERLATGSDQVSLSLLATSDVHTALLAYDYFSDRPVAAPSLARAATLITRLRHSRPGAILLDNGDFLQGTPLADAHIGKNTDAPHPAITAMTHLGYDAVALGNHEFNPAPDDVRAVLKQAQFPLLCANLKAETGPDQPFAGLWQDRVMLELATTDGAGRPAHVKLGLFGVAPPQVMQWDGMRLAGRLVARDMVDAAREAAALLVAEGADIVVALAHSGISDAPRVDNMENAASHIAALPDVDALVAGHVHRVFPGPQLTGQAGVDTNAGTVNGIPVVMPGAAASHLGLIDLVLERHAGRWRVCAHASHALLTANTPEDPKLVDLLAPAHARTLDTTRKIVATLDAPTHSYFAMAQDDRSVRIMAEAMLAHVTRELARGPLAHLPVLAAASPLKCGGRAGSGNYTDVAAGPMAMRAIADLQAFDNHLSLLEITGAELVEWLEMSASLYNQLLPDTPDQLLFDRDTPAYNREAIYGLSYEIDLSHPPRYNNEGRIVSPTAQRVHDVHFGGAPLDPSRRFLLATSEYRAGGGGHYPGSGLDRTVPIAPVALRDILSRHVRHTRGRVSPDIPAWRFRRLPRTFARFDTGAGAANHPLPGDLALELLGEGGDGFLSFRLDLGTQSG
ncbi:bifunctional 2',3'-cyclic-nucleotide 2'-phosphodiesterase/3'-nucleotidase [Shimia aestuarii]|uniref:2',3'-cyclic-nucleotide 2'-phosphodiesterase / 3'-nucleotidase n=1 Tax=Shimia aestuarii TaxID=254406 RepID=A0A1I4I876_9RHOB|nr:bifunctional 2',3'-cyclic-nucleotide 2'-phosphodiesterase/3'-nucleotidase [Shimia aestuarii]SFL50474.1 2',3'-cyclic-nucleotide 2'-phosphodiesterase / 3'-nucleotidase [Shimia aestuarii]